MHAHAYKEQIENILIDCKNRESGEKRRWNLGYQWCDPAEGNAYEVKRFELGIESLRPSWEDNSRNMRAQAPDVMYLWWEVHGYAAHPYIHSE